MSHELRTPLNGVLGMSQVLLRGRLTAPQRERVAVIHRSGTALLTVLNDVLELADVEAGTLRLDVGPASLEAILEEACETAETLSEAKGVALEVSLDRSAHGRWMCDATRLRQVLYNLVSNGLKFTPAGRVTVSAAADAHGVILTVSDTGVGIAPEALPHLFDKFTQGEGGVTRRFGGAGVGLAICRSLVELMGGALSVESRPGHGSTFTVRLPLERAPAPAPLPGLAVFGDMRVLIAEDNETNQRVVCTVLDAFGVEATVVADGAAAVEAWSHGQWDLVLMDIQMPVKDGVAATREIRRLEAERGLAPTPIVALTANALPEQAQAYAAAGMNGVVPKPIMIDQLHAALAGARRPLAA
jgi:CheY-like chemotaxis protein